MESRILVVSFMVALLNSVVVFATNNTDTTKEELSLKKKRISSSLDSRTSELVRQIGLLKSQVGRMDKTAPVELYAHGPAVVASPVFGLRSNGSGTQKLMINLTTINKDLSLIRLRQKMDNYAIEHGVKIPGGAVISLSGGVEGQLTYSDNYSYSKSSRGDIDLSRAELDIIGEVGPWATAAMIINYDSSAGYSSPISGNTSVTKVNNSRLQLDRAFLTAGQLNKFPLYFTIGQLYVPFGDYRSFMVTVPPTRILGRTKDRTVILGYCQHNINAQVYGLSGSTSAVNGSNAATSEIFKHGGLDVNYKYERNGFGVYVGAGILGNIAESEGLQQYCFGRSSSNESIYSKVLGYSGHVKFDIYSFGLLAEYIGASRAFDSRDLSFDGKGAKPKALDVEGAYNFKLMGKSNTVFAGYSTTSQALALNLPKQSYFVGYSIALIKNTLASIEYRHDVNYGWTDRVINSIVAVGGRHANTVTVQFGAYF